jgi:MFS family permease
MPTALYCISKPDMQNPASSRPADTYNLTPVTTACPVLLRSMGCIFARSIGMLLVFRVLQGAALGAYRTAATGVVSDVWCPAERGVALGVQAIPTLVGKNQTLWLSAAALVSRWLMRLL